MSITAETVKQLRERTGAGMMECKKALVETGGDLDAAAELMRKQGLAKADKKAARIAPKASSPSSAPPTGCRAMVEVNCETDFVAREQDFRAFAKAVAHRAVADRPQTLEALLQAKLDGGRDDRGAPPRPGGQDRREHRRAPLRGARGAAASGRLYSRHPHRRAGGGQGRGCAARARPRHARRRQQSALPVAAGGAGGGDRQGARDPHRAGQKEAESGQIARDHRQDGRGPACASPWGRSPCSASRSSRIRTRRWRSC